MKNGILTVNGKEYLLNMSTRVVIELQKQGGGNADKALNDILSSNDVEKIFRFVALLIDAGDRYAKKVGIPNAGTLDYEDLIDLVAIEDYEDLFSSLKAGLNVVPEVETESKNAEASQEK